MEDKNNRKLLGKIELTGTLKCLTGLHIGAAKENMEIGALDSPVVRDPVTLEPFIPGSSMKGKLRSLLEKAYPDLLPNRDGGSYISRHECNDWEKGENNNKNYSRNFTYPGAVSCPVCRLFGATGPGEKQRNFPSRLKVRDLKLKNSEKLKNIDTGLLYTEWKFENSIDRITSAANPRSLERVPKGAEFTVSIIYDVEDVSSLKDDMDNLKLAIQLLHDDALGGHGSRGYGQVKIDFDTIEAKRISHYKGIEGNTRSVEKIGDISQLVDFFQNKQLHEETAS
ncbi:MAG: type III-A CRISPR-associated RAMP protein Csm3 [bacterium]